MYREMEQLTQEELGKRVGITAHYLSRIELGAQLPSVDVLYLLSRRLHVSMDSLVVDQTQSWPPQSEMMYLSLFSDCDEREFAFLVNLLQHVKVLMRQFKV